MTAITAGKARDRLHQLVNKVTATHKPVLIMGRCNNAILIAEDDWRAINETLYLLSIPGMRESIRKGLKTPIAKCNC